MAQHAYQHFNSTDGPSFGHSQEQHESHHDSSSSLFKNARLGFVRKVFGVLSFQLTCTAFMIYLTQTNAAFQRFQMNNQYLDYLSIATVLILVMALYCVENVRRSVPTNYICLTILTLAKAYSVSVYTIGFPSEIVLLAGFITAGASLLVITYAMSTKQDISKRGATLFLILSCATLAAILNIFIMSSILNYAIYLVSLLSTCYYLIYNVQLVMGNSQFQLSYDDYILGSLMVYFEIIKLFIKILNLLGEKNGKKEDEKKKDKKN